MKYVLFDKEKCVMEVFYTHESILNLELDFPRQFIKGISSKYMYTDGYRFHKEEHECINKSEGIKNDERVFMFKDLEGRYDIWQLCCKASDSYGNIIPDTYHVRKIGFFVPDEYHPI